MLRPNRRKETVLGFLLPALDRELATLPPNGKLYAILDNLNIHHAAEVGAWAAAPERCERIVRGKRWRRKPYHASLFIMAQLHVP